MPQNSVKATASTTFVRLKLMRFVADKKVMDIFTIDAAASPLCLSFLSVVLFCLACVQFLRVATTRVPVINRTGYTRSALRVAKAYKVTAWGILVGVFLTALVISFVEVFTRL